MSKESRLGKLARNVYFWSTTTFGIRHSDGPLLHLKGEIDEVIKGHKKSDYADCLLLLLDAYSKDNWKGEQEDLKRGDHSVANFSSMVDELLEAAEEKLLLNYKRKFVQSPIGPSVFTSIDALESNEKNLDHALGVYINVYNRYGDELMLLSKENVIPEPLYATYCVKQGKHPLSTKPAKYKTYSVKELYFQNPWEDKRDGTNAER